MARPKKDATSTLAGGDPANSIRVVREALGLSLMEVAERVPTTHQTLQQWELKGNLQVRQLPAVARALGVTPAELVPGIVHLTQDERRLLLGYRAAGERERRTILRVLTDLTEPPPEEFEQRAPRTAGKKPRR